MIRNIAIIENNILATNTIRKDLTKALINHGYNITVLTTGSQDEIKLSTDRGIKVIDAGTSNEKIPGIIRYFKKLLLFLKKTGPDLCLTFTIRPGIWGNFAARLTGTPVISNITGIGALFDNNSFAYRLARFLYKLALKRTQIVFFQNQDDRDLFVNRGYIKSGRARIIPGSGINTDYFAPMEHSAKSHPFIFVYIGRLIRDKGVVEYVEAARIIRQKYPEILFRIAGPLWKQNFKANTIMQEELDGWIREGTIEYLGNVIDVRPVLAASDCVVIPSYREGMSNVLLEAGSMERPCITTDVTGCRDIVIHGETGLLCIPQNPKDLAEKMMEMIEFSEEQRSAMGKEARVRVKEYFEKKIVIDAYLQAINEI